MAREYLPTASDIKTLAVLAQGSPAIQREYEAALATLYAAAQQGREDSARLDWLEREAASREFCGPQLNWFADEHNTFGEPEYHFAGGFQIGDDSSEPYHKTLREAIDYARTTSVAETSEASEAPSPAVDPSRPRSV